MLTVKLEGLERAMRLFDEKIVNRACSQGINEAAKSGRTAAKKTILAKWNIKAKKVDAELKNIKMARINDLEAVVQAKGRPISLQYFGFKEVRRTVKGKGGKYRQVKGVTGSIVKAGGSRSYPGAFMATLASGNKAVLMSEKRFFGRSSYGYNRPRQGIYAGQKGRTPVVSLSTITIASMFYQQPVEKAFVEAAEQRFATRFNHHLDRLMSK